MGSAKSKPSHLRVVTDVTESLALPNGSREPDASHTSLWGPAKPKASHLLVETGEPEHLALAFRDRRNRRIRTSVQGRRNQGSLSKRYKTRYASAKSRPWRHRAKEGSPRKLDATFVCLGGRLSSVIAAQIRRGRRFGQRARWCIGSPNGTPSASGIFRLSAHITGTVWRILP